VPLLEAFKTEPQLLACVLPRQDPFGPHPQRMDGSVEASRAPAFGRLALAGTLCDVGDEARMEHGMPMACGITAAIEVEGGASQVRDDKRCGCLTTLATRDNCQKNEGNGNVSQRNHAYQSSPGLCRL
jgi:hypothetical protein